MQLRSSRKVKEEHPENDTIASEMRKGIDFIIAPIKLEKFEEIKIKLPLINVKPFKCDPDDCKEEIQDFKIRLTDMKVKNKFKFHFDHFYAVCNKCPEIFYYKKDLLQHHRQDHPVAKEKKSTKCEICSKVCSNRRAWRQHQVKHSDERKFECDKCGRMIKTKKQLKCHFAIVHRPLKYIFPCGTCLKSFTTRSPLYLHQNRGNCESGIYKYHCALCLQRFKNEDRLVLHQTIRHEKPKYVNGTRMYYCSKCSKSYKNFNILSRHLISHGFGREAKVCPICSKSFFVTEDYNKHVKLHSSENTRNFKCHFCPKSFRLNSYLAVHVKKLHNRG